MNNSEQHDYFIDETACSATSRSGPTSPSGNRSYEHADNKFMSPQKPFAPAADKNKVAICAALQREIKAGDQVLEIGSGTGQHITWFATHIPNATWQPSDLAHNLSGIDAWITESNCSNIHPPVELDVEHTPWPVQKADVCYSANTLHIMNWHAIEALFKHASVLLGNGGKLCIYGPFRISGEHVSESNAQFDEQLRARNQESGVRDLNDLDCLAAQLDFDPPKSIRLPANNFLVVWEKCASG